MFQALVCVPTSRWPLALLLGAVIPWFAGCGGSDSGPVTAQTSQYQVDDGQNAVPAPAATPDSALSQAASGPGSTVGGTESGQQPPSPPAFDPSGEVDLNNLPDDEPQLLATLEAMQFRQPRGRTQEEQVQDFLRLQDARIKTAEKLLAMAGSQQTRMSAVQAKMDALRTMGRFGAPNAEKDLTTFCRSLLQDEDDQIAFTARLMLFGLAVDSLAQNDPVDVQQLLTELKDLAADSRQNPMAFMVISQAAEVMQQVGERAAAKEAYAAIGTAFRNNQDPQMAAGALAMLERVAILEAGLDEKLRGLLLNEPASELPLMDTIGELLGSEGAGPATLAEIGRVAQIMEMTDRPELARQVHEKIEQTFREHADSELAQAAVEQAQNGLKRVALIGNPLNVEGVTLDGSPFDWSAYQGKVVLVDFWATWCQPCLIEMPNIARAYREYQARGFEVVGVNLDDDPKTVQRFMEVQPLPWTVIVGADADSQGVANPLAVRSGVDTLPFVVLVGRDGKVVALHVRGARLAEKLNELLGPPAGSPPPSEPAAEAPAAPPAGEAPAAPPAGEEPAGPPPQGQPPAADPPLEPPTSTRSAVPLPSGERIADVFFVALQAPPAEGDSAGLYAPPAGLSPAELVEFIFDLQDKPRSIQARPGFAEALVQAADRILDAQPTEKELRIAAETKFHVLHDQACLGDQQADAALGEFVQRMKDSPDERIAAEVRFFLLERKVVAADELPLDQLPELLAEVKSYLADLPLQDRHLRLASSTVHAINRLEDAAGREEYFFEFGSLFAKSPSKELSRYGKGLAKKTAAGTSDLVGKPLELVGVTGLGTAFDWSSYRDKVVLVDFWASWCGPCRAAMPQIKTLYTELRDLGFDVVGVNLDKDPAAVVKYVDENDIEWTNLVGEEAGELAAKYGIRGLPTMVLVDRAGIVVAAGHKLDALKPALDKLLEAEHGSCGTAPKRDVGRRIQQA